MSRFRQFTRDDIEAFFSRREGEVKLGEKVGTAANDLETTLRETTARFVLVGIPEDIGVRANHGVGGTESLWPDALTAILSIQHTEKLNGEQLLVLGAFDLSDLMGSSQTTDIHGLRKLVAEIDDEVFPVIEAIVRAGKLPIIIGGGHNNAYPILKGSSRALGQSVNCVNLDAHSDYRALEGRHSGNGFRYARTDGYLSKYAVIGLHENYNSEQVLSDIRSDKDIWCCFYEDIFLHERFGFAEAVDKALDHTAGKPTGIELDLDCIERTLSSASTPSGITALMARQYINSSARADVAYLHLTEGATALSDGRKDPLTAKLVAYLVTDFIKAHANKTPVYMTGKEI
jgi:formiminoglutamase